MPFRCLFSHTYQFSSWQCTSSAKMIFAKHNDFDVFCSLSAKEESLGSEGRHRCTKMDTFAFRGKHWGYLGYRSNKYDTHQPCLHSGWTWKGHVGSTKLQKYLTIEQIQHPRTQQVLRPRIDFSKKYKDQNDRIGKFYRFKMWLDRCPSEFR